MDPVKYETSVVKYETSVLKYETLSAPERPSLDLSPALPYAAGCWPDAAGCWPDLE